MESRKYSDWFGSGDLAEDVAAEIAKHGEPLFVFSETNGYMASLVYADKTITVGYDGNEYFHIIVCDKAEAGRTPEKRNT